MQNEPNIFDQYNNEYLKEHKRFLAILLNEEKAQARLREIHKRTPKRRVKTRKKLEAKIKKRKGGRPRRCFDYEVAKEIVRE